MVCFFFIYFAFSLNEDAKRDKGFAILKLILILFFVFTLLLIPKAVLDNKDNCELVVSNQTVVANETYFTYNYTCIPNSYTTATSFYKTVANFIRVFGLFIAVYFTYMVLTYFGLIEYFKTVRLK